MTPKNKVARAIKTSPNIWSQICSKNRWNKLLFLLSSSNGILSVNRVHHGVETKIAKKQLSDKMSRDLAGRGRSDRAEQLDARCARGLSNCERRTGA
jgi:hypothetical protein